MENKIKQTNPTLHKYLFTVTTFSKLLAMALFIILPFAGFYLGMHYQQKVTVSSSVSEIQKNAKSTPIATINKILSTTISSSPTATLSGTISLDPTGTWKIYTDTKYGFQITIPAKGIIIENNGHRVEGDCGVGFKTWSPQSLYRKDNTYLINIDGFFGIFIAPWTKSLNDYIDKTTSGYGLYPKIKNYYVIAPILGSNADTAFSFKTIPGHEMEGVGSDGDPFHGVIAIYKKGDKIYVLARPTNSSAGQGCISEPTSLDPSDFSNKINNLTLQQETALYNLYSNQSNWGWQTFKFIN